MIRVLISMLPCKYCACFINVSQLTISQHWHRSLSSRLRVQSYVYNNNVRFQAIYFIPSPPISINSTHAFAQCALYAPVRYSAYPMLSYSVFTPIEIASFYFQILYVSGLFPVHRERHLPSPLLRQLVIPTHG